MNNTWPGTNRQPIVYPPETTGDDGGFTDEQIRFHPNMNWDGMTNPPAEPPAQSVTENHNTPDGYGGSGASIPSFGGSPAVVLILVSIAVLVLVYASGINFLWKTFCQPGWCG